MKVASPSGLYRHVYVYPRKWKYPVSLRRQCVSSSDALLSSNTHKHKQSCSAVMSVHQGSVVGSHGFLKGFFFDRMEIRLALVASMSYVLITQLMHQVGAELESGGDVLIFTREDFPMVAPVCPQNAN